LGPFVSFEENKCCEYNPGVILTQHNFLFDSKMGQEARVFFAKGRKGLPGTNTLAYWPIHQLHRNEVL
jgi:hypothetical protein